MALYYRSQLQGSGSSAEVNSYYVIQGENRWLSGDPRLANLNKSTSDETIIIGDNIFNAEPMNFLNWSGSVTFNSPLIVGNNCYAMLRNCTNLNKPITLGKRCICRGGFKNCKKFNSTVTIYNTSEINCSEMFESCYKYNQSFNIPSGITDCSLMYSGCIEFNQPVNIPDSVNRLQGMFKGCSNFNQQVRLPNSNAGCFEMFNSCTNFNQPVNIPDNIFSCYEMFVHCTNFNSQVTIGNNVTNCNDMFSWCENFNQPVNIPDSVTDCTRMFYWCMNFNSPVKLSNNMKSCDSMFYVCRNYRLPINVPDGVQNCVQMFTGCGVNHVVFGNSANNLYQAFGNVQRNIDIYINYKGDSINVLWMFYGWGNVHNNSIKNVYFNPKWTSVFKRTLNTESITGYNTTWTDRSDGNGFYNAKYNVYCYNNYVV